MSSVECCPLMKLVWLLWIKDGWIFSNQDAGALEIVLMSVLTNQIGQQLEGRVGSFYSFNHTYIAAVFILAIIFKKCGFSARQKW